MTQIRVVIPGPPVPKGRPRFGNGHAYTPAKTVNFEAAVALYARREMNGEQPYDCPIEVRAQFVFDPPKKMSKTKQRDAVQGLIDCTNAVDIDNALKAILDACNRIVYVDDHQVVKVTATKAYGPKAHTMVEFTPRIRGKE